MSLAGAASGLSGRAPRAGSFLHELPAPIRLAWNLVFRFVVSFSLLGLVLLVWEIALWGTDHFQFKPPSVIFATLYQTWLSGPATSFFLTEAVWRDIMPSLGRVLGGWALGAVIGIAVGVVAGLSIGAREYIDPVVSFLRSIPKAALVPTFIIVFGASEVTRIIAIAASTTWLVLMNAMHGIRTIDPVLRDTGRVFNIPPWKQFVYIMLPAAAPKIFAGLRVTLSIALKVMLVAEWLLTEYGLGFYLLDRQRNYDIAEMWAALFMLAILGYLLSLTFLTIERRVLRWHAGAHGRAENK